MRFILIKLSDNAPNDSRKLRSLLLQGLDNVPHDASTGNCTLQQAHSWLDLQAKYEKHGAECGNV